MILRKSQHVGVIAGRLQRRRKQYGAGRRAQTWPQERCWHNVAQCQHPILQTPAWQCLRQLCRPHYIAQRVLAKLLRQPRELDRVKVELLQLPG